MSVTDAKLQQYPHIFLTWPAGIKVLILDSVSGMCYPSSIAEPHPLPSHPISPSLLQAVVPDGWPLRPIGEVSAGLVSRICSEHPPPVSVSREQPVCLARLGFLPIFPLCQTEKEGSREGESSGMLPIGEGGQQRKQEKYIFLSLLPPSKALYSSSFCVSCSPVFTSSIAPASHFVLLLPKPLILLVLPHTHSLILNLFFPLY